MKNNIAFIFTFIILAFGAVFSAPKCKAFDLDNLIPTLATTANSLNSNIDSNNYTYVCNTNSSDGDTVQIVYIYGNGSLTGEQYSISSIGFTSGDYVSCNVTISSGNTNYPFVRFIVSNGNVTNTYQSSGGQIVNWTYWFVPDSYATNLVFTNIADRSMDNLSAGFLTYYSVGVNSISNDDSSTNFRALFQGAFDITYIDDDNGNVFPVQVYSSWYRKNGVETEILRLGIVDSNSVGWSYNGHFHFSPRISNITAFRWLIGSVDYETIDDFELPTVNNSSFSLSYHLTLFSNDNSSVQTGVSYSYTSINKYNIDIGNGDVRYKGFKDSFIASQFDSEFTSPEVCSYFFFDSIDYYPYNTRVSTYILDGDIKGLGARTALDNTKIDDETRSYSPLIFTGDTVPVDFPDFNLDNFDFTGINSLLGCFFDSWYVSVLLACISVGIVGYVLFGKS